VISPNPVGGDIGARSADTIVHWQQRTLSSGPIHQAEETLFTSHTISFSTVGRQRLYFSMAANNG